MELDNFEMEKCCRACKSDTNDLQDLFSNFDKDSNLTLCDMVMECTSVQVRNGDGLPHLICHKCISQLEIAYNFKKRCENIDISFRTILAQQQQQLQPAAVQPDSGQQRSRHTKIFRCKICDKTLTRMEHTRRHMTIHLREKPYHCGTCKRGFNKTDNLKVHEAKCTGQRPHICPICNRGFGREDSMQVHMESTHRGEQEKFVLDSLDNIEQFIQIEEVEGKYSSMQYVETSFEDEEDPKWSTIDSDVKYQKDLEELSDTLMIKNEMHEQCDDSLDGPASFGEPDAPASPLSLKEEDPSEDDLPLQSFIKQRKEDEYKCDVCQESFSRETTLKVHLAKVHDVRGKSPQDPEYRPTRSKIKKDAEMDESEKVKCSQCSKTFQCNLSLEIHMQIHTSPTSAPTFKCTKCSKTFPKASALKRHLLSLHVDVKPYECKLCDKKFTRKDHLNRHVSSQHEPTAPHQHRCEDCNKSYPRADSLIRHRAVQHGVGEKIQSEKKFECVVCHKGFTTEKYRDIHMRAHDDVTSGQTTRRISCKACDLTFQTKEELAKHLKTTNDCSRRFLCSECGQRFTKRDYLEVHIRRHRGEKPFKCRFCGKGFPRTTDLKAHEKCHTGEKTHLCIVCGKGFGRAYKLTLHMRTHTGEKPYRCQYCDAAFAQSNDLKAHTRRHTGERYYCDVCNEGFLMGYMLTQHKKQVHGIDLPDSVKQFARLNQSAPQPIKPEIRNPVFLQPRNGTTAVPPPASNVASMGFHDFFSLGGSMPLAVQPTDLKVKPEGI